LPPWQPETAVEIPHEEQTTPTMNAKQKVFRVRRNYNKWVANQTLEDYALRFTAKSARRWSAARVSNTALGAISFLALEAIGGAITLSYGFSNAVAAICVVGLIIFLTGIPITYHAAKYGIDIDLLTRGAGFGYIGSTITSLIYASFTFIFFALEAAIMATAMEITMGVPLQYGYLISAVVVIPLVTHGITLISRFQLWTQPFWVILQLLPFVFILWQDAAAVENWTQFEVTPVTEQGHFDLLLFGAAASVVFSLIAQIGEQVDYLRFIPHEERPSLSWKAAMIAGGPGWIVVGVVKILAGSFLAVLAINHGVLQEDAAEPTRMYLVAFSYVSSDPVISLALVGIFVIICQLKINVTNAYAGSIAWSNFFSRLTHNHPGRVVWLVFNVAIALMLMELGIYQILEEILGVYAIVALAWVGALVADLVINKPLSLRPPEIEFKRAHLYDINPVGVGAMLIASIAGISAHIGLYGEVPQALSSFLTLAVSFVSAPLIAWYTNGKFYIARSPVIFSTDGAVDFVGESKGPGNPKTGIFTAGHQHTAEEAEINESLVPDQHGGLKCCICEHRFEKEDMSYCPAYQGAICSLCCSLDARCHDVCKSQSRFAEQLVLFLGKFMPEPWVDGLNSKVGNFIGLFILISAVVGGFLIMIYFQIIHETDGDATDVASALWKVSFIFMIISGVIAWMFVLVHDSRRVAQQESSNQTTLLLKEIKAHEKTDRQLQLAKEQAEAANLAKSRYLTGISHELRSPLNAVLGYTQLLEKDEQIPANKQPAIATIRRSGEHLADLIEGLLDISKIEADRLDLNRTEFRFPELLHQLVNMFQLQAESKGIEFCFRCLNPLPEVVKTDEKRLRQILINLLSNALKYTHQGRVEWTVAYRNQVAEFTVNDSGQGIAEEDFERIFKPFERVLKPGAVAVSGTGLGLTITRLLTDIMGGELSFESKPGVGSTFRVSLFIPSQLESALKLVPEQWVKGYQGEVKTLMIVDDNATHRALIKDCLSPLGFTVVEAHNGMSCLELLQQGAQGASAPQLCSPDLFMLDVSMPGIDGWALACELRANGYSQPIVMISADASEGLDDKDKEGLPARLGAQVSQAYLVKPIRLASLLEVIGEQLQLQWLHDPHPERSAIPVISQLDLERALAAVTSHHREELLRLATIGYAKGIEAKLDQMEAQGVSSPVIQSLRQYAQGFQFASIIALLTDSAPSKHESYR